MMNWKILRPSKSMALALLIGVALATIAAGSAQAGDQNATLGGAAAVLQADKPLSAPPPVREGNRQGGDTIEDAVPIPDLPYLDTGNTCEATDDMDVECPYASTSPDVFYSLTVASDMQVTIDLCNSLYDTKLFVLDAELNLLACDDDFYNSGDPCGGWISKIGALPIAGGQTVYIGVDGWGGECGEYLFEVTESIPCDFACPPDALPEGEPPLAPDQADHYNGGCWSDPPIFQEFFGDGDGSIDICATSGWYWFEGDLARDSDWFRVYLGPEGLLEFTMMTDGYRDVSTWMNIILPGPDPGDPCFDSVLVEWDAVEPCTPSTYSYTGDPGAEVWIVTAPVSWLYFEAQEYEYYLSVTGIDGPVGTEVSSWSSLKALYR